VQIHVDSILYINRDIQIRFYMIFKY
jgi:hypothetical protein